MAKKNINNNRSGDHSFYKEANKSILGQQQMTPKKFGKLSLKVIKWMVFAFLIITTLWGCVNEFILQTSNNLGQGVEFYQENDFVYPNMYQATDVVGYTATANAVSGGTGYGEEDKEKKDAKTVPFNFIVMNPYYGYEFIYEEGIGYEENAMSEDKLFINASEVKTFTLNSDGEVNDITLVPKAYSYNLNQASVLLTGIYDYTIADQKFSCKDIEGIYAFDQNIPKVVLGSAQNDIGYDDSESQTIENFYEVKDMKSFAFYLFDYSDEDGVDGTIKNDSIKFDGVEAKDFFNFKDEGTSNDIEGYQYTDVSSINGSIRPIDTLELSAEFANGEWVYNGTIETNNFEVILESKPKKDSDNKIIEDETTKQEAYGYFLRQQLFISGDLSGQTIYNLICDKNDGVYENDGVYDGAYKEVKKAFDNTYPDIVGFEDPFIWSDDDNLSSLKPDNSTIYSGTELMVIPIKKGFPVEASEETKELIDGDNGFRPKGFQDLAENSDSKFKDQGIDYESQMYGWMLVDSEENNEGKHDLIRTYSSPEEAIAADQIDGGEEEDYFYADQRREGWGTVSYGETQNQSDPSKEITVFDEKIKHMMTESNVNNNSDGENTSGYYLSINKSIYIGDQSVDYTTSSQFAGITNLDQMKIYDESYLGVLPQTTDGIEDGEPVIDYDEDDIGTPRIVERSILSDSVIPTGQDAWGKSRITFIGWDDWGKAWGAEYGPLYGMFVFPLAQISMAVGEVFNYALSSWGTLMSIIVIVFLTRGFGALLSLKGTKNQMKMQEVQTEVAKIKARYSKYNFKEEPKMKQKQQQEIMALYRKNDVSPMGSISTIFITMPIFISLWIIISSLPAYKLVIMGNFSWAISAWSGIFGGFGFGILLLYVLLGFSVGLVQGVSSKLPGWLANKRKGIKRVDEATKKSMKKQNRTQNIMVGVFVFMGLTVPALFAFYWIASGSFTITLELGRHGWRTHTAEQIKIDPTYKNPTEKFSSLIKKIFHK